MFVAFPSSFALGTNSAKQLKIPKA